MIRSERYAHICTCTAGVQYGVAGSTVAQTTRAEMGIVWVGENREAKRKVENSLYGLIGTKAVELGRRGALGLSLSLVATRRP